MPATRTAVVARVCGAALLAAGAAAVLRYGGASWPVAVSAAAGALACALWRTVTGAIAGCALLLLGATLGWSAAAWPHSWQPLVLPLVTLELYGLATVAAVAMVRDPRRVSRRLLGCWLASSGLLAIGVSLGASLPARGIGSALIAAALAWRLGTAPVYAWAPLLMRHPAARITVLGVVASLGAGATLLFALPRLPHPSAAATTVAVLSALTVPWATWHAVRQWRRDRRCSLTYAVVLAASQLLLLLVGRPKA